MKNLKRVLGLLLSLALMLSCVPTVAFAETVPALPTATITEIENDELTFAMNFLVDMPTQEQFDYYGDWYADFELTVNKTVTFNANGGADGYLAGQYDAWSENWVNVPFEDVTLEAGQTLKIMAYAAEMMGKTGLKLTYADVCNGVQDFDCGVFFDEEFLAANPDLKVTLELKMYNPADETESYVIGETYVFEVAAPELPTATITEIENDDLTFAMNFLVDMPTQKQFDYYGDWYADFELTVNKTITFNANGGADGWLSGQYDAWSENWVNVPFEDVTLEAGQTLKIMAYAAEMMGKSGLKLTYADVCNGVQDFDCGVFFDEEFLAANPDLKVTLELKMYNPADETESYVIGETYVFEVAAPERPTATVTETENDDLTFSMNFKVDDATLSQQAYYGKWYADFELTVNKTVTFNANGGADGWLSGQYDAWSENWVNVPFENVTLEAGQTLKIMAYAAEMMGEPGLKYTYQEVYEFVKDFDCGVFFSPEYLMANPDLVVTLELKMYNPADESESYVIGETYIFENNFVAYNTTTGKCYTSVNDAMLDCAAGQTVALLQDTTEMIVYVLDRCTLDLNGKTLTSSYVSCFGDIVDNSADNTGLLVVDSNKFMIREDNAQLPIRTENGYLFAEIVKFNSLQQNASTYVFQPFVEANMLELLKQGGENTGVTIQVQVSWKQSTAGSEGYRTQNFVYDDSVVKAFLNSYIASSNRYDKMFTLTLKGAENFEDLTFSARIVSETNVTFSA